MENEISIEVKLDKKWFEFSSFQNWVNKASSWYGGIPTQESRYITIDAKGRICVSGREFMRARDDGSFPVSVYNIL